MMTETRSSPPRRSTKQEAIRTAAQQLFLARGFAGTTTDAITAAAGVSKETLYRYYASKDVIFADVLGHLTLDRPDGSPLDVLASAHPANTEELRQLLTDLAVNISAAMLQPDYVALVRITIAEASRFPELGMLFRERVPERVVTAIANLFWQMQQRGVIGQTDPRTAALLFIGPLVTRLLFDGLLAPADELGAPTTADLEALVDLVMNAVTRPVPG